MICCFSGHRHIASEHISTIGDNLLKVIGSLYNQGVREFRCGGALGFDTLAAEAVIAFKKSNNDAKLHLILPCRDQTGLWSNLSDLKRYQIVKGHADSIAYTEDYYSGSSTMLRRNRQLVDGCNYAVFYLIKNQGGTYYTYNYAKKFDIACINIADF